MVWLMNPNGLAVILQHLTGQLHACMRAWFTTHAQAQLQSSACMCCPIRTRPMGIFTSSFSCFWTSWSSLHLPCFSWVVRPPILALPAEPACTQYVSRTLSCPNGKLCPVYLHLFMHVHTTAYQAGCLCSFLGLLCICLAHLRLGAIATPSLFFGLLRISSQKTCHGCRMLMADTSTLGGPGGASADELVWLSLGLVGELSARPECM